MLKETCVATIEYLESKSKAERKKIGQFFTSESTAEYMGRLFDAEAEDVTIADFGVGTGILTAAVLDHLFRSKRLKSVRLDLFENDEGVLPVLEKNISLWQKIASEAGVVLTVSLIKENLITYNQSKWRNDFYQGEYDCIISNPPYKKISKDSVESRIMDDVVYGQPNLYFLFMALACKLLKENGALVFIVPRSWTSGLYFKVFREYLLSHTRIEKVHQFVSRKRVFEHEDVLQETMILKAKKTQKPIDEIVISSSAGIDDFSTPRILKAPYALCINRGKDRFVYLPTSDEEVEILSMMASFEHTLTSLGFRMKTGPTVDFRTRDAIHDEPSLDDCPLFWSQNFSSGRIRFPVADLPGQYISSERKSLLIAKDNYLLVKRFSSKEERRRLQPAILSSAHLQDYDCFSVENHLNYIGNGHGGLHIEELYGLYVIFNSTLWDRYYRILNGSTQVNATECNCFPMPDLDTVRRFGKRIQRENRFSTEMCDLIIKEESDAYRRRENDFVRTGYAEESAV
jgi:adenine-specific DNA-methyltransferase